MFCRWYCALIVSGDFWDEVFHKIQDDMKSLYQWLLENSLFLNIVKTFILFYCLSNNKLQLKKHIVLHSRNCINWCTCDHKLKICIFTKYLGIIMSSNLKWIDYINFLATKLRKLSYAFKQLKCILNISRLKKRFIKH